MAAIVSNMPGPSVAMRMGGAPIRDVYPMLPLAERVPLGVGTLGWNGQFCIVTITDPCAFPGIGNLAARIVAAVESMLAAEPAAGPSPGSSADPRLRAPRS